MPSPSTIYSAILASSAAVPFPLVGLQWPAVANALAQALSSWAASPGNLTLTGTSTGTLGTGPVTGIFTVAPQPALVLASLVGAGVAGPLASSIAVAVSNGVSQGFSGSAYVGVSTGVGSGTDQSIVLVANPSTLVAILAPLLGVGPNALSLALGLSQGVCAQILTGTGFGSVNGAPSPSPGTGITTSAVV